MQRFASTFIAHTFICFIGLLMTGCPNMLSSRSSTGSQGALTPAEQQLREQGRNFNKSFFDEVLSGIDKTTLEGALTGAGVGALAIGGLTAGGVDKVWKWAVGAGAAGVGTLAGAYVSSQQKKFARTEDLLDDSTQKVQSQNEKLQAYVTTAQQVLDENRQTLANTKKQYAQGQITKKELDAQVIRAQSNRQEMAATLEQAKNQMTFNKSQLEKIQSNNRTANVQALTRQVNTNTGLVESLTNIEKAEADVVAGSV